MSQQSSFITWQPVLTDHQAFTYEQLSLQAKTPVLAYVLTMEDATRRSQGWSDTQVESIERRLIPSSETFRYCYRKMRKHRHDVHLFGSAFQNFKMLYCLLLAIFFRVEFYIVSEPYSPIAQGYFKDGSTTQQRLKSALRPYIYKLYMFLISRRMSGVFAISSRAVAQYIDSGVSKRKIFPFGYFVPSNNHVSSGLREVNPPRSSLRIVFVGALIARKGLDLLIEAVKKSEVPVFLDVYGAGDPALFDFDGGKVRYCGTIPFGEAQEVIVNYDFLVLPSRYDGWGVVVNEALCAGVPVICSDQVGAAVIVENFGAGAVFKSGESKALELLISALWHQSERLLAMHAAIPRAAAMIQPSIGADYMLAVLRARPADKADVVSPWYVEQLLS